MNDTAIASPGSPRLRALLAALISVLLIAAGAVIVPPAHAAGGTVTPTVTSADTAGLTVQVQASGLPDVTGAYAALIVKGTESGLTGSGGYAAFALPFPRVEGGASSFALTAAVGSLDRTKAYEVLVWQQHSNPNETTIYGRGDVAISAAQWDALFGTTPTDPGETDPGTDPGETDPGTDPGETDPGETDPGETDPGTDPGETDPGETDPGETDPGETDPGETDPGTDPVEGEPSAAIAVFLADGVTPATGVALRAGDRIVVKGSGYDPTANVGGRGVPIPAHLPQGTYVVFGNFGADWQPSAGAASSTRSVGAQAWALAEGVLDQVPAQYQGAIRAQWVDISADGSFQVTLTLKDTPATPGSYGVYTYAAGGVRNADQERSVALDYRIAPTLTASVESATAKDGLTVTAAAAKLGAVTGAYVALIEAGTEADVTAGGGFLAMQYVRNIDAGAFTVDLNTAAKNLDRTQTYEVIVWKQHTMPNDATIHARAAVTITDAQWTALLGDEPEEPAEPKPPVTPTTPPVSVPGGSLRWAISTSFANYVAGPIAQGAIQVSGGATRSGGQFQFGQTVGGDYDASTGLGSVVYRGAVRFTGHHGVLDVTVSDPVVRVTSTGAATVYVTSGGAQVPFATLDLTRAARITANGAVTYSGAPATLTAAGRDRVLSGYSTTLDPVTFTIGSAAAAPSGSTGTVAAAAVVKRATLPATPPASEGIDVDEQNLAALASGQPATVTASGFRPNEEGIKVVVYSTPVLLDTVTADASGVATWSGALPAALEDGAHTLTFQGSVDRGLAFTLARATAAIGACTVEAATLNWGYKESFRTYIEGIAKGGWTLTDVAYRYPDFVWENGAGSLDGTALTGLVTYGGSIAFTGHDGALNTTLGNARVELAGDTGYLVFDVTGTTQAGESVDQQGVRLAEFPLADAAVVDGALRLDAVATTLTEAGAAAFGTYQAGEQLDPVTAVIPVDTACGTAVAEEPEADAEASAAVTAVTEPADTEGAPVWPWIVGGLVVVALAAGGGVLIARRSRTAQAEPETTEV
ncbi:HtaA domain-containing protein [Microbacterium sp. NPDC060132]|uniref:HtaA domain-containing protein n=1 Tax=unclassified Microbacterium TaxID=2609290 RepID=UPI0036569B91